MAIMESTEGLIRQMLDVYPRKGALELDAAALVDCIEACVECEHVCTACADASLAQQDLVELVKSIRLWLDCAEICAVTAHILTRQTEANSDLRQAQVTACVQACRVCAAERQRHASHHEHHRICAETCRRCEGACNRMLKAA